MMYLVNEALLRLIKPLIALVLGAVLYWLITGVLGEPGSARAGPRLLDQRLGVHPPRGDRRDLRLSFDQGAPLCPVRAPHGSTPSTTRSYLTVS